jgi:hypothetical protein
MGLRLLACAAPLFLLAACVEVPSGAQDHSATVMRASEALVVRSLAVVPLPEAPTLKGLPRSIEPALVGALRAEFPTARVLGAREFATALGRTPGYAQHFARWRASYERTQRFDRRPLRQYARASGARYLLVVRSTRLDRDELEWKQVEAMGCCFSKPGARYWRTRLSLIAELIDAAGAKVVWRGRGEADQLTRGDGKTSPSDEVTSLLPRLIETASTGLASQIAAASSSASAR